MIKKHKITQIKYKDFCEKYLLYSKVHHSERYTEIIEDCLLLLENFIKPNCYLSEISTIHAKKLFSLKQKYAYSHNSMLRTLKSIFNYARREKHIRINPFLGIKKIPTPKNNPIYINKDDFVKIIGEVKYRIYKAFFIILYYTGMRVSELIHLRWVDIDLNKKEIYVRNHDSFRTKSHRERTIPMNNRVYLVFRYMRKFKDPKINYIFYEPEGRENFKLFDRRKISKLFKHIVRQLGLNPDYKLHGLRHTFCTNLARQKVSIHVIKKLAGHSDIKTTEVYLYASDDQLVEAIRKLT
ncbi:MAG: tyrosine recombinase XerD [Ignavibacterium sp.]|nr:MAG: tyrosine recombinase XerD [Ignavibacterium sp.]